MKKGEATRRRIVTQAATLLNQSQKNVKDFRRQRDGFQIAQEHALAAIKPEAAKLVEITLLLGHKWL